MPPPSTCSVFDVGNHTVKLFTIEPEPVRCGTTSGAFALSSTLPPKPLLVGAPCEGGEFAVLLLLHGYLLYNSFYSQLIQRIASHGFIVIAPQLYKVAGPDSTEEIKSVAAITDWLIEGLEPSLPPGVTPNLSKLAISGHSRGGKVAFAMALGFTQTNLEFSAVIGIDPVDGMDRRKQTKPRVLTSTPRSFDLNMPALVIGSGLGGMKKNPLFPPCAPEGVSHAEFFDECGSPACHFVAKDYGHLDMLDDETEGLRGKATFCLCKSGEARRPMREFVGGVMVAFMRGYLNGELEDLVLIRDKPETAPVEISVSFV